MAGFATYDDVVAEVAIELRHRLEALVEAGVAPGRIVLDPGLGFAKNVEHDWELLRRLDELLALGQPLLIGASRKSFLGTALATTDGVPPPMATDAATAAVSALAAAAGVYCVRVHDVRSTLDAVHVAAAWTADGWVPIVATILLGGLSSCPQWATSPLPDGRHRVRSAGRR
jgi:dihydropteroate synthase